MTASPEHAYPTSCVGWLGKIFGHKFVKSDFWSGITFHEDNCFRCGMPQGGWR